MAKSKADIISEIDVLVGDTAELEYSTDNKVDELLDILEAAKDLAKVSNNLDEIVEDAVEDAAGDVADALAQEAIETIVEDIIPAIRIVTKRVSLDILKALEKAGSLIGNTSIIDGFCNAKYKETQ